MSLQTYNDLIESIQDWPSLRGEPDLERVSADIVTLAEAKINRDLRLQGHIVTLAFPDPVADPISEYPLPDDFTEMDRLMGPDGESIEPRPADELVRQSSGLDCVTYTAGPAYAIDGRRLLFAPPITNGTMRYYQRLAPLETSGTNWLYAAAPDLYLYASLIEVGVYSKEPPQEYERYQQAYVSVASALIKEDMESRYPRSQPLRSIPGSVGRKQASTS